MKYRIFETEGFIKDIGEDFEGQQKKILKKLRCYVYSQLKENPQYGLNIKKLKNFSSDTWRYRIGDYRFFYHVDEKEKNSFYDCCRT